MNVQQSCMNLVEVGFGFIECQAIRRGTFRSLNAEIRAFSDNCNDDRAYPVIWTKI